MIPLSRRESTPSVNPSVICSRNKTKKLDEEARACARLPLNESIRSRAIIIVLACRWKRGRSIEGVSDHGPPICPSDRWIEWLRQWCSGIECGITSRRCSLAGRVRRLKCDGRIGVIELVSLSGRGKPVSKGQRFSSTAWK